MREAVEWTEHTRWAEARCGQITLWQMEDGRFDLVPGGIQPSQIDNAIALFESARARCVEAGTLPAVEETGRFVTEPDLRTLFALVIDRTLTLHGLDAWDGGENGSGIKHGEAVIAWASDAMQRLKERDARIATPPAPAS